MDLRKLWPFKRKNLVPAEDSSPALAPAWSPKSIAERNLCMRIFSDYTKRTTPTGSLTGSPRFGELIRQPYCVHWYGLDPANPTDAELLDNAVRLVVSGKFGPDYPKPGEEKVN